VPETMPKPMSPTFASGALDDPLNCVIAMPPVGCETSGGNGCATAGVAVALVTISLFGKAHP
jgi:hypothetical protein